MPEMVRAARWACTSPPYRLVARRVVLPWALQGLTPTGTALEIGAGSGAMGVGLLARYPGLSLVVTDYDPGMIAVAGTALTRFGARATVQQADAARLSFADDRFSVVFCFAMLHHVGDWRAAVREALRVLRPGGRFVGYDVLDGALTRLLHCGEGDAVTMIRRGELEAELGRSMVSDVSVRASLGGMLMRFTATKQRE